MHCRPSCLTYFGCQFLFLALCSVQVQANGLATCGDCGKSCSGKDLVTCSVMEPTWVIEKRVETMVVKHKEQREETYTVFQKVPVTRRFEKEVCYLENAVKTQTVVEKKCHLVEVPVQKTCAVKVHRREMREIAIPHDCAATCGGKGCTKEKQLCEVLVEDTEMQDFTACEVQLAIETNTHEITYCVKVPTKRKELCCEETTYQLQPVQRTRMIEVSVPRVEKRVVEVPVCKMMPRSVDCCSTCAGKHNS